MATAYVEAWPQVEPQSGLFLVTAASGDEKIRLALTRHALIGMQASINRALALAIRADMESEAVIPFPKRRRAKKGA